MKRFSNEWAKLKYFFAILVATILIAIAFSITRVPSKQFAPVSYSVKLELESLLRDFVIEYQEDPNSAIRSLKYLPEDRWGNHYYVRITSDTNLIIASKGADEKVQTSDDIIVKSEWEFDGIVLGEEK